MARRSSLYGSRRPAPRKGKAKAAGGRARRASGGGGAARGEGGAFRYIVPAGILAGLLIWLWPRPASADEGDGGGGGSRPNGGGGTRPNGGGGGGGGTDPNEPHPPPGTRAIVAAQPDPSLRLRSRPSTSGSIIQPPTGARRDPEQGGREGILNGRGIRVIASNIPQEGLPDTPGKNRWWELEADDGRRGFARAQDGEGHWNFNWTRVAPALRGSGPAADWPIRMPTVLARNPAVAFQPLRPLGAIPPTSVNPPQSRADTLFGALAPYAAAAARAPGTAGTGALATPPPNLTAVEQAYFNGAYQQNRPPPGTEAERFFDLAQNAANRGQGPKIVMGFYRSYEAALAPLGLSRLVVGLQPVEIDENVLGGPTPVPPQGVRRGVFDLVDRAERSVRDGVSLEYRAAVIARLRQEATSTDMYQQERQYVLDAANRIEASTPFRGRRLGRSPQAAAAAAARAQGTAGTGALGRPRAASADIARAALDEAIRASLGEGTVVRRYGDYVRAMQAENRAPDPLDTIRRGLGGFGPATPATPAAPVTAQRARFGRVDLQLRTAIASGQNPKVIASLYNEYQRLSREIGGQPRALQDLYVAAGRPLPAELAPSPYGPIRQPLDAATRSRLDDAIARAANARMRGQVDAVAEALIVNVVRTTGGASAFDAQSRVEDVLARAAFTASPVGYVLAELFA